MKNKKEKRKEKSNRVKSGGRRIQEREVARKIYNEFVV